MTASSMSTPSIARSFLEEERRAREEIQQFEELEKEFASNRHGIQVKFDDEQGFSPAIQTTIIKTESCFQVNSTEDQVTKYFYQNEFQPNDEETKRFFEISSKTPSERDSLEEERIVSFKVSMIIEFFGKKKGSERF